MEFQLNHERPDWRKLSMQGGAVASNLLNLLNPHAKKILKEAFVPGIPCGPGFCRDRDRTAAVCALA